MTDFPLPSQTDLASLVRHEAGRRLRIARLLANLKVDVAAEVAGCGSSTWHHLEAGDRDVAFSTVVGACDAVGIPIDWLTCGLADVTQMKLRGMWAQ